MTAQSFLISIITYVKPDHICQNCWEALVTLLSSSMIIETDIGKFSVKDVNYFQMCHCYA